MIIKNNFLRIIYNLSKWTIYPFSIAIMVLTVFPNQPVKAMGFCIFFAILSAWNSSKDASSE
jgi:hypothetical protein